MKKILINCDMGEGFGRYTLADDAAIMPLIDMANIACGFHASDPVIMRKMVGLAAQHGVKVGAHPSLPDLQGFGRRNMSVSRDDLSAILTYQIGALKAFADGANIKLSHIKPHGALYGMALRDKEIAHAVCDAAEPFDVPVLGLAGSLQEDIYRQRGIAFISEFYADLPYDEEGMLVIGDTPQSISPRDAAIRVLEALEEGRVKTLSGSFVPVKADSVCVHSDSGNPVAVIQAIRSLSAQKTDEA